MLSADAELGKIIQSDIDRFIQAKAAQAEQAAAVQEPADPSGAAQTPSSVIPTPGQSDPAQNSAGP
jgi:hypothetical protein